MNSHEGRRHPGWASTGLALAAILMAGLMLGSCAQAVEDTTTGDAVLMEYVREQYVVGVSDAFAARGDLEQARERLAALGDEDPEAVVVEIAESYVQRAEDAERTRRLIELAQALGADAPFMEEYMIATAPTPTATNTSVPTPSPTSSPTSTATGTPVPTATNTRVPAPAATPTSAPVAPVPAREWDVRLDYFWPTVRLEEAQVSSGQWYWRLSRTKWLEESGNHHIYVEVLDEHGNRSFGQTIVVEYGGSPHPETYPMPDKLGEEYAYNFVMGDLLGSYNVYIGGSDPSDKIYGAGLGTRQDPYRTHHTCFFLTFQRTYQP